MTRLQDSATEGNFASFEYGGETYRIFHPNSQDHIFKRIQASSGFYEVELLEMLRPALAPGDLVVDVGANIGNHTVFFAGVCGCRVIAIEPNQTALEGLRRNVEANGLEDRVSILPYAVGAAISAGRLHEGSADNIGLTTVEVDDDGDLEIRPLDDLVEEASQLRLIKIDVEGMEMDVLKGAKSVLQASRPILALEAATVDQFSDLETVLKPLNYTPVSALNYTPTHVFVADADEAGQAALSSASGRRFALQHIDQMRRQSITDANISRLSQRVDRTEANHDRITAALEDIAARMENVSKTLDHIEGHSRKVAALEERLPSFADAVTALGQEAARSSDLIGLRKQVEAFTQEAARSNDLIGVREHIEGFAENTEQIVERIEKRLRGDLGSIRDELGRKIDGTLKAELLLGEAVDGARIEARRLLKEQVPHDLSQVVTDQLSLHIEAMTGRIAAAIGKSLGDAEHERLLQSEWRGSAAAAATGRHDQAPGAPRNVWEVKRANRAAPKPDIKPELLAEFDISQTWENLGWAQGGARLADGGVVAADADMDRIGVVSRYFECKGGGLLEIEVESEFDGDASRWVLRVGSDKGEPIGQDFTLRDGVTRVRIFAPGRVEHARVFLLLNGAKKGETLRVGSIRAKRLDPDAHQREVSRAIKAPVIASLAAIPRRQEMLADSVASLLAQCDEVRVFLNNYEEVPDFLDHPRVDVKRSQDWDDRGDAGKFFWIDKEDHKDGYRLIVDDDLLFPPDYAKKMTAKVAASGNRAIYTMHAILLRQPFDRYYDDASRAETFHFSHSIKTDRGVHVGGTGAMCFHARTVDMRWDDFKYCNSADTWLSLYAQKRNIPLLTPERPFNWIMENRQEAPNETIYAHALKQTKTRFDSSLIQDAMLRREGPLTIKPLNRHKLGLFIEAADPDGLRDTLEAWLAARDNDVEWVVTLIYPRDDARYTQALEDLKVPNEIHVLDVKSEPKPRHAAFALHETLALDASLYLSQGAALVPKDAPDVHGLTSEKGDLEKDIIVHIWRGEADQSPKGISFARTNDGARALHDSLSGLQVISAGPEDLGRVDVSDILTPPPAPVKNELGRTLNSVFERVQVINLDRRPDRWERTSAQLAAAGATAERFSAADGRFPEIQAEYAEYCAKPLVTTNGAVKPVIYSEDLYVHYESQNARIAHIEQKANRKAIASPGAWGYLRSYERILEAALTDQVETLMVFDDDVSLHRDFETLFDAAMQELPDDWLILQLGTLQYNWSDPWMKWRSPTLYQTSGVAIGSHAVGMRFEIMPFLLDHVKRMDLPFDVGALSATVKAFSDRCYVIYPNLAIQALGESEISTSEFQKSHTVEEIAQVYRWRLQDYDYD